MLEAMTLLGCGRAAQLHSRTLQLVAPDVRRFYASRDGEKARDFSQRFGGHGWYHGYDAALADERTTLALVLTPPATHLDLTLAALRAGKHVIVEKPAFLDTAECDVVAERARLAGRQVLVAENYFYKPLAATLRTIIAGGRIGAVRLIRLNARKWQRPAGWRTDPRLSGGGPLFEGGIHWLSLLNNIGPEISALRVQQCGSPLTTVTTAQYAEGGVAILTYSWEARSRPGGIQLSHLQGTTGDVIFESNGLFVSAPGARIILPGLRDLAGYRAMFQDLLAALQENRSPRFTLARARRDIELLQEAVHTGTAAEGSVT